jgi:hypothetical protein
MENTGTQRPENALRSRLAQASGALSDIQMLVTDCVSKTADPETLKLAESVLERILCSADKVRNAPGWYRHEFERRLFERYLGGETKACATDVPCIVLASEFSDLSRGQNG